MTAPCATLADVREMSRQLMRANESNPDPCTAVVVAEAVVLALLARERHGVGQTVHVNMLTANMYANADDALDYAGKPAAPGARRGADRAARRLPPLPHRRRLAVPRRRQRRRVAPLLGGARRAPSLADDARFATATARADHDDELTAVLADLLGKRPAAEWEQRLVAAGVAGVRADASTPGPFFAHHEQVLANDFAPECTHARFGPHRRWGPIVRVERRLDRSGPACSPASTPTRSSRRSATRRRRRRPARGARRRVRTGRLGGVT